MNYCQVKQQKHFKSLYLQCKKAFVPVALQNLRSQKVWKERVEANKRCKLKIRSRKWTLLTPQWGHLHNYSTKKSWKTAGRSRMTLKSVEKSNTFTLKHLICTFSLSPDQQPEGDPGLDSTVGGALLHSTFQKPCVCHRGRPSDTCCCCSPQLRPPPCWQPWRRREPELISFNDQQGGPRLGWIAGARRPRFIQQVPLSSGPIHDARRRVFHPTLTWLACCLRPQSCSHGLH